MVTGSGGRAVRLRDGGTPPAAVVADLDVLEPLREVRGERLSGTAPYWEPGTVIDWCYGQNVDPVRVVRDDERGLVAWLAPGTEVLASVPVDGRGLRDRPLVERFVVERELRVRHWQGPGVLRVAPTGVPWSVWWFWDDDWAFEGHYVNLELVHERTDVPARTVTRDLVLDLVIEAGPTRAVWLKDEDELEAAIACGRYDPAMGDVVRALGERARHEMVGPWAWPLDEHWESWRPPAGWEEPLELPARLRPSAG